MPTAVVAGTVATETPAHKVVSASRGKQGKAEPRRPGPVGPTDAPMRLNRYIARSGVCSRRKADELIQSGRVHVNGEIVTDFSTRISPGDKVAVNGKRISPASNKYILLNKPTDAITTTDDERGRTTVLDLLKLQGKAREGVFPVGRLDRNTTGVLLLTNDGELANRLMHPRYEIDKLYRATLSQPITADHIKTLRDGVELEDGRAAADYAAIVDPGTPHVVGISIHEGRNRQIRRMLESLGYVVERLERVRYAGLTTKGLRRGKWRHLKESEVASLYRKVRLKTK